MTDVRRFPHEKVERATLAALTRSGADEPSAVAATRALMHASLLGVDSHGVRLAAHYSAAIEGGRVKGAPRLDYRRTAAATGMLDADDGLGHPAAYRGMRHACELAGESGLGAVAIDYRNEDFVAAVREATSGRGVDVVLDMVGAPYLARNLEGLALEGRLVQIAIQQGARAELDLWTVMQKRLTVTGSLLRPRTVAEKGRIAAALREEVWPEIEGGRVRPVVYKRLPLAQAAEAHRIMEAARADW